MYYLNLFPIKKLPEKLYQTNVIPVHNDLKLSEGTQYLKYKHAALIAQKISEMENPVASYGQSLISSRPIDPSGVTTDLQHDGLLIQGVQTEAEESIEIDLFANNGEYLRNYSNKYIDHILEAEEYIQSERFFWKPSGFQDLDNKFKIKSGLVIYALVFPTAKKVFIRADCKTRYYSKQTVWDTIQEIVAKKGLSSWREAEAKDFGFLYGRSVESSYRIWKDAGYWEYQSLKIKGVDLTMSISDQMAGKSVSVKQYQENLGRKVDPPDQPCIIYKYGNTTLYHVPSLLVECPNTENLKKYSPRSSLKASKISRLDPRSRYFQTCEYLDALLTKGIIGYPEEVDVDLTCPQITMDADYLEIKTDRDFAGYFSKRRLARAPDWAGIHFFIDRRHGTDLDQFVSELKKMLKDFKITVSWVSHEFDTSLRIGTPAYYRDFGNYILDLGKAAHPNEMVMWAISKNDPKTYNMLKSELTVRRDIPTQQLLTEHIEDAVASEIGVKASYINPLFTQLVAKMGGYPYLFQEGITIPDSVFVGLDRFRDSYRERPSNTAAAACFGNHGEYLGAGGSNFDPNPSDEFYDLDVLLPEILDDLEKRITALKYVIVLRDGTNRKIGGEVDVVFKLLQERNLTGAFITANKTSNMRIYKGDPVGRNAEMFPEQYICVKNYYDPKSFLVTTTQPIIEKGTPLGVARPVLYSIERSTLPFDSDIIKGSLSRGVIAFTRLNWVSFKGTRLPSPLDYAHDLAHFCADLQTKWPVGIKRPTFL